MQCQCCRNVPGIPGSASRPRSHWALGQRRCPAFFVQDFRCSDEFDIQIHWFLYIFSVYCLVKSSFSLNNLPWAEKLTNKEAKNAASWEAPRFPRKPPEVSWSFNEIAMRRQSSGIRSWLSKAAVAHWVTGIRWEFWSFGVLGFCGVAVQCVLITYLW